MAEIRISLLGTPHIERDGQAVQFSLKKAQALYIYLAMTGTAHSRDALTALFWPENDQRTGRANLRRTLYRIHQAVGEDALDLDIDDRVALHDAVAVWIDAKVFEAIVAQCLPPANASPTAECLANLMEAYALYRGDFMEGFSLPDCPAFDEWQFFLANSLRQHMGTLIETLILNCQQQEAYEPALHYARRWVTMDNLNEAAHRELMRLYALMGHPSGAVRQFQECARILEAELGIGPSNQTIALLETIRNGKLSLSVVEHFPVPKISFVRSGDVHIAYQVLGDGPLTMLLVSGFVTHVEHIWEQPEVAQFLRSLAAHYRIILFDKRGVGLSDRVGYPPTIEDTIDDILAILEVVRVEKAILFGTSEGGPVSIAFADAHPERVHSLILYATVAKGRRTEDYPWAIPASVFDRWVNALIDHWGTDYSFEYFAPSVAHRDDFRQWWAKLLRLGSSPGAVKDVLESLCAIDVRHHLPHITMPTLILHRTHDKAIWVQNAHYLAANIPTATYIELEGADHWWFVGNVDIILNEIFSFIASNSHPATPRWVLSTIVALKTTHQAALETFTQRTLHQELEAHRGSLLNHQTETVLVAFDSPTQAIRCLLSLRNKLRKLGVQSRAVVHLGECEVADDTLTGQVVDETLAMLNFAIQDDILVTAPATQLMASAHMDFVAVPSASPIALFSLQKT